MARHSSWFGPLVSVAIVSAVLPPVANATVPGAVVLRSGAAAAEPVQAGQVLANDGAGWVEVAFADGSSIVLGPGARVVIEGLEAEGGTGRRVIALRHEAGTVRIALARGVSARVTGPQGTTVLQRGTALIALQNGTMTATLLSGGPMTVSTALGSETIRRPGFATSVVAGGEPGSPQRQQREALAQAAGVAAPLARNGETGAFVPAALVNVPGGLENVSAALANMDNPIRQSALPAANDANSRVPERVAPPPPPAPPPFTFNTSALLVGIDVSRNNYVAPVGEPTLTVGNNWARFVDTAISGNWLTVNYTGIDDTVDPNNDFDRKLRVFSDIRVDSGSFGRLRRMTTADSSSPTREAVVFNGNAFYGFHNFGSSPLSGSDWIGNAPLIGYVTNAYVPNFQFFSGFLTVAVGLNEPVFKKGPVIQECGQDNCSTRVHAPGSIDFPLALFTAGVDGTSIGEEYINGERSIGLAVKGDNLRTMLTLPDSERSDLYVLRADYEAQDYSSFGKLSVKLIIVDATERRASADNTRNDRLPKDDRVFFIGGQGVRGDHAGALPTTVGTTLRYAISDGIRREAGFTPGHSVEWHYSNTPEIPGFTRFNAFRPEQTFVPGAPRGDTHLLVVAGDATTPTSAMRVDLQVQGTENRRPGQSSASVSVGGIAPLSFGGQGTAETSLAMSGSTVGSARLGISNAGVLDANASASGSTAILARFGSLATGQNLESDHLFRGSSFNGDAALGDAAARENLIGYFAVGDADARLGKPNQQRAPGTFGPAVPGGETQPVAFTRLASGVGSVPTTGQGQARRDQALVGFAAAMVESVVRVGDGQPTGSLYSLGTRQLPSTAVLGTGPTEEASVRIETRANLTTLNQVLFTLTQNEAARLPNPSAPTNVTITFGGTDPVTQMPRSAYANETTFAALGQRVVGAGPQPTDQPSLAMASVNDDLVRGLPRITPPGGAERAFPASSEHVQWGFFLGDLVNTSTRRDHIGMGFWVAGRPVTHAELGGLTGRATYSGGMIGNVVDGRNIRTATGGFAYTHDFGTRTGGFSANFDGATWQDISTRMGAGSNVFSGSGTSTAGVTGRDMSVQGSFFNRTQVSAPNHPAALGGTFAIAGGETYRATGVFVGSR